MSIASRIEQIEQHLKDDYDVLGLAGAKGTELPIGYTQVDYIESSGTQYINTGINPISSTKIDIDFAYLGGSTTLSEWIPIFGARTIIDNRNEYYAVFINRLSLKLTTNYSSNDAGDNSTVYVEVNKKYNLKNNQGSFYINDILESSISASNTLSNNTTHSVYLFDLQQANSERMNRNTQMKLYSCKFYDGDTLIRNFVPCYRNSDNEVGLYDLVNDVFYTNQGTGAFTYGSVVLNRNIQNLKPQWLDRLVYFMNNGLNVVWENWEKVTGTGTSLTLNNTINAPMKVELKGNTSQEVIQGEVGLEIEDTSIYVDDVNEDKENYITLKGNTYQETTTGKNLFHIDDFNATSHGITLTIKDNTFTLNGTNDGTESVFNLSRTPITTGSSTSIKLFIEGGTATNTSASKLYSYVEWGNQVQSNITEDVIKPMSANVTYNRYVLGIKGGTFNNYKFSPMIAENLTSTDTYEPYTNGASPNPDYPQEIEVVTGLNEVKVENKNLFNKNSGIDYGKFYTSTGDVGTDNDLFLQTIYIPVNSSTQYTISGSYTDYFRICEYDKDKNFIQRDLSDNTTTSFTITTTAQTKYVRVSCFNRNLSSLQFEQSLTATTYEAYKGQTYEVNLGKNLFDKNNYTILNGYLRDRTAEFVIASSNTNRTIVIKCKPNTIYTVQKTGGNRFSVFTYNSLVTTDGSYNITNYVRGTVDGTPEPSSQTISTGNDEYLYVHLFDNVNNVNLEQILSTIQIEKGSKATSYAPYFEPIELCKIGTYQDRIYKSNIDNNWYVHKEIGKIVLNGSENWEYDSTYKYFRSPSYVYENLPIANTQYRLSNYFKTISGWGTFRDTTDLNGMYIDATGYKLCFRYITYTTPSDFKTWLSTHNTKVYYVLATATDTQITDTTLVNQLEALYTASIHAITHINTETSNLLPYIDLKYNVVTASPSPDRASEVKVVTGNNTIKVEGKNLFDGVLELGNWQNETGEKLVNSNYIINTNPIPVEELTNYKISLNGSGVGMYVFEYKKDGTYNLTGRKTINTDSYLTTNSGTKYINFRTIEVNIDLTSKIQVEKGSQATTYEAYTEQDYEVNLGKNLFDKDNSNQINHWFVTNNKIVLSNNVTSFYIKCKPNTQYTLSKVASTRLQFWCTTETPDVNVSTSDSLNYDYNFTGTTKTITTTSNANYLLCYYYLSTSDTKTEEEIRNSIQIEQGSKATTYAPYFTPIELCEIGNYKDYIMKSSGKNIFDDNDVTNLWCDYTTKNIITLQNANMHRFDAKEGDVFTVSATYETLSDDNSIVISYYDKNNNNLLRNAISTNSASNRYISLTKEAPANTEYVYIGRGIYTPTQIQVEKGTTATQYEPYGYDWYVHKEVGKVVFDGSETIDSFGNSTYEFRVVTNLSNIADGTSNVYCLCDKMIGKTGNAMWNYRNTAGYNLISSGPLSSNFLIILNNITTSSGISSALSTLKPVVYYVLTTPTNTKITNENLISQLEALSQAKSRNSQTNISQSNSNLPFILDATALKQI